MQHTPRHCAARFPDGLFRLTVDLPEDMFDELHQASLRRGIPLDRLVVAALCFAAMAS